MGALTPTTPQNGSTPTWFTSMMTKFLDSSAHAFGLSGAINDYVGNSYDMTLARYLGLMGQSRAIVLTYSTHRGVQFSDEYIPELRSKRSETNQPRMRDTFANLAGLNQAKQKEDPILGALKVAQGQASGTADDLGTAPADVLPLLDKVLRQKCNCLILIEHAENIVPAGDVATKSLAERNALALVEGWGHDPQIIDSGNIVVLITASSLDVHADLRTASCRYVWLDVALPTEPQRLAFLEFQVAQKARQDRALTLEEGLTLPLMAAMTAGLMKSAIEDIVLAALARPDQTITRADIKERKAQILAQEYRDVVEILDSDLGLDALGGLAIAKDYLRKRVIRPIQQNRRTQVPTGILLIGPPGTGKSALVTGLGFESGFNVLKLNPEKIYSKYVGEAERNLERFLQAAKALSPCFIFIDEIDQKVSRGDGGSQVFNNVFGMLLEFIAKPTHKGQICVVAATNKPLLIDPALIRAGRIEIKLPIMPASDDAERHSTFEIILRIHHSATWEIPAEIIASTQDWTGAEIAKLCSKAAALAQDDDTPMSATHLLKARSLTRRRAQDYAQYIQDALDCTEDIELLPERWRVLEETRPAPAPTPVPESLTRAPRRF